MHNYAPVEPATSRRVALLGIVLFATATAPALGGELFSLYPVDGRLVLFPRQSADYEGGGGRYWSLKDGQAEFQDYNPHGFFDGRVSVRDGTDGLEVCGWRSSYRDWQMTCFALLQTRDAASARYTIRTPAGMSDITVEVVEPDLTLLLIRHPEVTDMLGDVMTALGEGCWFEFDRVVLDQINPNSWHEPSELGQTVRHLLETLDSGAWKDREHAEQELASLGRDGALYLLSKLDRASLSAQQNLVVDRLVRRYPLLSPEDREICQREPARLRPAGQKSISESQSQRLSSAAPTDE
jgi:hypothetical protein